MGVFRMVLSRIASNMVSSGVSVVISIVFATVHERYSQPRSPTSTHKGKPIHNTSAGVREHVYLPSSSIEMGSRALATYSPLLLESSPLTTIG